MMSSSPSLFLQALERQ
uniref:Uncharacterized protein n=1 Tax=Anguilla anguilla TaxID=7936 RepID=A0A0E9VLW6_ANGAN